MSENQLHVYKPVHLQNLPVLRGTNPSSWKQTFRVLDHNCISLHHPHATWIHFARHWSGKEEKLNEHHFQELLRYLRFCNCFLPLWLRFQHAGWRRSDWLGQVYDHWFWQRDFFGLVLQVLFVLCEHYYCLGQSGWEDLGRYLYHLHSATHHHYLPDCVLVGHWRWLVKLAWFPWRGGSWLHPHVRWSLWTCWHVSARSQIRHFR